METWRKKNIIAYHKKKDNEYAGDVTSATLVKLCKNFIGEQVLDVGAGSGALIDIIPRAIGIDLVSKHPQIVEGDLAKLPFKAGYFDTIFSIETLEHLDTNTLKKGVKEIFRVLKTNGHFIIKTPYKEDFSKNRILCPKCGAEFHRVGHIQKFDDENIKQLLEKTGFKVVKIRVLPPGYLGNHKTLKYWNIIGQKIRTIDSGELFVIAQKNSE